MVESTRFYVIWSIVSSLFFFSHTSVFADSLTGTSALRGTTGVAMPITDLQIVSTSTGSIPVKLLVTSGSLQMITTTGLTFNGGMTGSVLYFSGTLANLNAALATLRYTRSGVGSDTLEVSLVDQGEVFFSGNNHLYEYISSTLTWGNAKTAAEGLSKYGATGYLTTITSQEENDFVSARLANAGWMGASDSLSEGVWKWATGPESNTQFWSGNVGGSSYSGNYANWNTGEPNDSSANEDCGQFLSGASGKWNDLPCTITTLPGYVVEYGAPGNLPTVTAKNISITTEAAPAVSALSPADNATNISPTVNLVMTFNKTIATSTGNILLKKVSDNTTIESIDVAGSKVTTNGTNIITINPDTVLSESTGYYVIIPGTAFKDLSDVSYTGITASSTWNFSTGDFTAPSITIISTSAASTTATIEWSTNENASTQAYFGPSDLYGSATALMDTSPRIVSHSVTLSGLIPCTTYYFQAVSTDASSNTGEMISNFETNGCVSVTPSLESTSTPVTVSSAATSSLTSGDSTISVVTPSNFTATSSTVVIQIQSHVSTSTLEVIGKPASMNSVGSVLFDVKAIINSTTILDSFDIPVTITYQYTDSQIEGIDESTLRLYHYHNNAWIALDDCNTNSATNIITCTTPNFSLFSLFGMQLPTPSIVSGGSYFLNTGTMFPEVIYSTPTVAQTVTVTSPASATSTTFLDVRDLTIGMKGDDVQMLQELLMREGYIIPAGATSYFFTQTKSALSKYQKEHGILPSVGYFGQITRNQMKSASVSGLWW